VQDVQPAVAVIGSINYDVAVRAGRLPSPGETVLGREVSYGLGGKGANQAVAAAMTGVPSVMVGAVGDDEVGARLLGWLRERGVDVTRVQAGPGSSGTAHIVVDDAGANQIVVVPGANAAMTPATIDAVGDLVSSVGIVVLQGELPVEAVQHAVALARDVGTPVLLNLAPIIELRPETLAAVDFLVVNDLEAASLLHGRPPSSIESALEDVRRLAALGPSVVITLGSEGAVWASGDVAGHVGARAVSVVDTTGAGDALVGVLAASLASGADLEAAVEDGVAAATLSVQHVGAGMAYPAFALGRSGSPR
jgi:ribokinase